jgi:hypothetical protein
MKIDIPRRWISSIGEEWVIEQKLPNGKYLLRRDPDRGWLYDMRFVSEKQLRKYYLQWGLKIQ